VPGLHGRASGRGAGHHRPLHPPRGVHQQLNRVAGGAAAAAAFASGAFVRWRRDEEEREKREGTDRRKR